MSASRERWRRTLRRGVFLLLLVYMVLGPAYHQVLGRDRPPLRAWTMFRGVGLGVVDAVFVQRLPDGREIVLDRYQVLGHASRAAAPREVRRIVGRRQTWEMARRLCAVLGPDADVRVISREAYPDGWRPGYTGLQNLCVSPPPGDETSPAPGKISPRTRP